MIAIDTETHLISPGQVAPRMVCLTWARSPLDYGIITREGGLSWDTPYPENQQKAEAWVQEGHPHRVDSIEAIIRATMLHDRVIGHNLAYDLAVIAENFPDLQHYIWDLYERDGARDTMIRAQLEAIERGFFKSDPRLNNRQPRFSLDELTQMHLGIKLDKSTWRLRYSELDGTPLENWPAGAIHYATGDAVSTFRVFGRMVVPRGLLDYPDEWLQVRAAWAFHLIGTWGITTDREAVEALRSKLKTNVQASWSALEDVNFVKPNGVRNLTFIREAAEQAFAQLGEDPPRTDTGLVQLDEDARQRIRGIDDRIDLYHDSLTDKKTLNDFVPSLKPLINARFNNIVRSGRGSCSNPNMQQPPQKEGVRECCVPRDGNVFLVSDIDRAEMCGIAEICYMRFGFSELGEMLKAGIDPHSRVAAQIAGVSYEYVILVLVDKNHPDYANIYRARQLGKIANFGKWGGMGAVTFVGHCRKNGVIISLELSYEITNAMKALFPEMTLFFNDVGACGNGHTRVQLFSGRHRGDLNFTNGCNTQFQGVVAEAAKEATYELERHYYIPTGFEGNVLYGCRLVNFIHDEWISEAPKNQAKEALAAKNKVLQSTIQKWMPHVPITLDGKAMERWSK